MKIGLFFGSFNPMHLGHKIIASYIAEFSDLEKVLFVVSPQNPLKQKRTLLDQNHRLQIIKAEVADNSKLDVSDVEFSMPQPSYTIDTLVRLKEDYPEHDYALIMGADNLQNFHKWKNFELLLKKYPIYVYKRPSYDLPDYADHENIHIEEAPLLDISASFIRKQIKLKRSIKYLVPDKVYDYLQANPIYDRL